MRIPRRTAISLVPLVLAGAALAGDHHNDGTLRCADCHVMHYSQAHGYNPDGSGQFVQLQGGPHEYLLRAEVNDLCLSCHDQNSFAPDVLGSANGGNGPTDVRLAGFLNRFGGEGLDPTGHTLDSLEDAPGAGVTPWNPQDENGTGKGLNCINCHHQHGYAGGGSSYRNLKMDPGFLGFLGAVVTYNDGNWGTNDLSLDVFERQRAEYDESVVDWNEPDPVQSKIGQWCAGCHPNFHGEPGDLNSVGGVFHPDDPADPSGPGVYEEFFRHPTAGVNIGDIGGGHSNLGVYNARSNKVKVMSEVGVWDPAGSDVTPTCISCHKAHGNGNAYGLIYRSGSGTPTENGDTGAEGSATGPILEHLCGQCHVQASFFATSNP